MMPNHSKKFISSQMYTILFTQGTFDQSALKRVLIDCHVFERWVNIYNVYKCCNHGDPYTASIIIIIIIVIIIIIIIPY